MAFVMPLEIRQRVSAARKRRYQTDPEYRLTRINDARKQRGTAPIRSLDEMGSQGGLRPGSKRGDRGRFI